MQWNYHLEQKYLVVLFGVGPEAPTWLGEGLSTLLGVFRFLLFCGHHGVYTVCTAHQSSPVEQGTKSPGPLLVGGVRTQPCASCLRTSLTLEKRADGGGELPLGTLLSPGDFCGSLVTFCEGRTEH